MKKLRTTSVLPTRSGGHPKSLANSPLSKKRNNRNLFFKERNTGGDVLSPLLCPVPLCRAGLCAESWPSVVSGDAVHMSECGRRNAASQLCRAEFQKFLGLRSFLEPKK